MVWVPLAHLPLGLFSILPRPNDALKWVRWNDEQQNRYPPKKKQKRDYSTAFPDCSAKAESSSIGRAQRQPIPVSHSQEIIDLTAAFPDCSAKAESSSMGRAQRQPPISHSRDSEIIDLTDNGRPTAHVKSMDSLKEVEVIDIVDSDSD